MKKIISTALILSFLAACGGTGDRSYDMPTTTDEPPTNQNQETTHDTSASNAGKDTSTTTNYDTSAGRQQ